MFRSLPPSPTPFSTASAPFLWRSFRRVFKLTATRYVDLARAVHLRPGQPIYFAPSGNRTAYIRRQVGPSNLEMCFYAQVARKHFPLSKKLERLTRRAKIVDKAVPSRNRFIRTTLRRSLGFRIAHGSSAVKGEVSKFTPVCDQQLSAQC